MRCALRTLGYMRGVMSSHNHAFTPASVASRDALVIASSSPDLPPLQDFFSQTSNTAATHVDATAEKKSSAANTSKKRPAATKNRQTLSRASTSKYWAKPSAQSPVILHDTPSTKSDGELRPKSLDDAPKVGFTDVLEDEQRSPSQPWKVFKSPPRTDAQKGVVKKDPKFASKTSSPDDSILILDEKPKVTANDQSIETPKPRSDRNEVEGDPFQPLNLEQAVARRLDWTPPAPKDISCDEVRSVSKAWTSSFGDEDGRKTLRTVLTGCGYVAPEDTHKPAMHDSSSVFLNKRKLIELVPTTDANRAGTGSRETSPTKPQAVKKKARTITEMATAAYQLPAMATDASPSTATVVDESRPAEKAGPAPKTKSKPRKKPAKAPKKNPPKKPVLLSPSAARKAAENQDFVFGTSSQLAREQSPTLLRDIQAAMRNSVQFDESHILDVPINSDTIEPQAPKPTLWDAGARNLDGELFDVEIVDLVKDSSNTSQLEDAKDPFGYTGAENEPLLPPLPSVNAGNVENVDKSFETLSDILPPPKSKTHISREESTPLPAGPEELGADDGAAQAVTGIEPQFPSKRDVPPAAGSPSNTADHLETAPQCPTYELFTDTQLAKEFASYGFKPVKKRTAMIALLEQCWRSKTGATGTGTARFSTSAASSRSKKPSSQAAEEPASPKKARGRPRKSPTPATEEQVPPPSGQTVVSPPRSRGRPRKSPTPTAGQEQVPPPSGQPAASPKRSRKTSSRPKARATSPKAKSASVPSQNSPRASGRGRPRKSPSPSPGPSSRATKSKIAKAKIVVEIPDSESDNDDFSSIASHSPLESATDLSTALTDDADLSLSLSTSDDQKPLFEHISKAITTAPRSTDPENPSWHEKILLYDPVIIEDLAAWLNLGQLTRVGYDGEVSAVEVKQWCESKSICCLARISSRGKERKRY